MVEEFVKLATLINAKNAPCYTYRYSMVEWGYVKSRNVGSNPAHCSIKARTANTD